jgi:hypothetical protein
MRAQTQVVGAVPPGWRGAKERRRARFAVLKKSKEEV